MIIFLLNLFCKNKKRELIISIFIFNLDKIKLAIFGEVKASKLINNNIKKTGISNILILGVTRKIISREKTKKKNCYC